jgi:signal transduction histidine kinase
VTDKGSEPSLEQANAAREILRRAGHELRNALSGVAVNLEVVRSRAARDGESGDIKSFAERAASQISEASALADGVLALTRALLVPGHDSGPKKGSPAGAGSQIELMIYGESADALMSDIKRLASRIDVEVEEHARSVILRVYPQGTSHSKN